MLETCQTCEHQSKCEETKIMLCLLKDNERVVKTQYGTWVIVTNWLSSLKPIL